MMTRREEVIRTEFMKFETMLRMSRWATIDAELRAGGMAELSSQERDEVDMAAATGMLPFDSWERSEDPTDPWSQPEHHCEAPAGGHALRRKIRGCGLTSSNAARRHRRLA
jgi:hypothetical protein